MEETRQVKITPTDAINDIVTKYNVLNNSVKNIIHRLESAEKQIAEMQEELNEAHSV